MHSAIRLIKHCHLQDFPSGSSINFLDNHFYLVGDDSTHVLMLDNDYQPVKSIHLFDHAEKRIPKHEKVDLEGSAIMNEEGIYFLLIVGSGSRKNRKRIIKLPLDNPTSGSSEPYHTVIKTKYFIKRITDNGIEDINIEGVTLVDNCLILANRGNRTNEQNHLIITTNNFWEHQDTAKLQIIRIAIPGHQSGHLGLSEICYIQSNDMLFLTLTSENTLNAYHDGEIGDSYLGVIRSASTKLTGQDLQIETIFNLAEANTNFKGQKIEGICVESIADNSILLHLISDNDQGESTLFKVALDVTPG